jgi:hypothetical protein
LVSDDNNDSENNNPGVLSKYQAAAGKLKMCNRINSSRAVFLANKLIKETLKAKAGVFFLIYVDLVYSIKFAPV